MKNILPIIITFLVTAIASSSITYFVTVDKNGEKEEAEINIEMSTEGDNNTFSSRPLTGQAQVVSGTSSKNAVEIVSAELAKTADGNDVVIITFIYSRLSGDVSSFPNEFNTESFVYQNGVDLENVWSIESCEYDIGVDARYANVKAGYSNEFKCAFLLRDTNTNVVVECVEYSDNYIVSRTFGLN